MFMKEINDLMQEIDGFNYLNSLKINVCVCFCEMYKRKYSSNFLDINHLKPIFPSCELLSPIKLKLE